MFCSRSGQKTIFGKKKKSYLARTQQFKKKYYYIPYSAILTQIKFNKNKNCKKNIHAV